MDNQQEVEIYPVPEASAVTRSEMVGVLRVLLQKNLSLSQAIALSLVHVYSPALARTFRTHLERTLHPQFREIVEAMNLSNSYHRKKGEEAV